ncbi:50S ribosomal protein L21 [Parasphingopyxis marina]|uniref:Large ribosomal subunit protein bL21 n=1 Tax=Parasphingopyxis marina TaxID=2761622 RepID=A0A842HZT3_9SPHN|nr:50S ribosomal protein L21 [Parasphingopyxis marina]MBC2777014.1 50S ribosomal protein L21 [Parasphingopyxis marina]
MFAVVRTGGKQYRVAEGDIITVEKLAGEAGDAVSFDDVLMAGDGGTLKDTKGLSVGGEILEQGRGDKVLVFKKKRRHNYRRKNGHRQYLTAVKITSIGGAKKAAPKKAAAKTEGETEAKAAPAAKAPAKKSTTTAAAKSGTAAKAPAKKAPAKKAPAKKAAPKAEDKDA